MREAQCEDDPFLRALAQERAALEVVHEALSHFSQPAETVSLRTTRRALEIRAYLDRTLDADLSLIAIARDLGMSVSVLQTAFREGLGETVAEYRRDRRLDNARRILQEEGLSVGEVARRAGYRSAANFATAFSRRFGYAPSLAARS